MAVVAWLVGIGPLVWAGNGAGGSGDEPLPIQAPPAVVSPVRGVCEIPAIEYHTRRHRLGLLLGRTRASVVIRAYFADNEEIGPSRQDNDTVFLTGLDLLGVPIGGHLVVTPTKQALFLPAERTSEAFTAARELARRAAGFAPEEIFANAQLAEQLPGLLENLERCHVQHDLLEEHELFHFRRREFRFPDLVATIRAAMPDISIPAVPRESASAKMWPFREIKSAGEIDRLRQANRITSIALRDMIRHVRAGMHEGDLRDVFLQRTDDLGSGGKAFGPIIASGRNSLELHYQPHGPADRLPAGGLLLLDVGAEYLGYAADYSRTVPIDGTFSAAQRRHYEAVVAAQMACAEAAKAGVSLFDVHRVAVQRLAAAFPGEPVGRRFPHLIGHHVGLHVHDPINYRLPLAVGAAFTIEPGWYDATTGDGVRIEDTFYIADTGDAEMLSDDTVPRDPDAVERLVGSAYRQWRAAGLEVEVYRVPANRAGHKNAGDTGAEATPTMALKVSRLIDAAPAADDDAGNGAGDGSEAMAFARHPLVVGDVLVALNGVPIFATERELADPITLRSAVLTVLRGETVVTIAPQAMPRSRVWNDARLRETVAALANLRTTAAAAGDTAAARRAMSALLVREIRGRGGVVVPSALGGWWVPSPARPLASPLALTTTAATIARVGPSSAFAEGRYAVVVVPVGETAMDAGIAVALELIAMMADADAAPGVALEWHFVQAREAAKWRQLFSGRDHPENAAPRLVELHLGPISASARLEMAIASVGAPAGDDDEWLRGAVGRSPMAVVEFGDRLLTASVVDAVLPRTAAWRIGVSVPPPPAHPIRPFAVDRDSLAPLTALVHTLRELITAVADRFPD